MSSLLVKALAADHESDEVDFKESFHIDSKGEWCEILKDCVAMANSGGGILLIGINDDGQPSEFDVTSILNCDPANFTDKMFSYTGRHFSDFRVTAEERQGATIAAIEIGPASIPLIFTAPGNYQTADGKQKMAFQVGVVYFRHGAKSEPGTSDDLQQFLDRELNRI